jgi:LDH2 family malate/lactate/ureidoglycolate dehydrogenase
MEGEPGVRMPGATRLASRAAALSNGLSIAPALLAELRALAGEAA